jgi:hypothetical protein
MKDLSFATASAVDLTPLGPFCPSEGRSAFALACFDVPLHPGLENPDTAVEDCLWLTLLSAYQRPADGVAAQIQSKFKTSSRLRPAHCFSPSEFFPEKA